MLVIPFRLDLGVDQSIRRETGTVALVLTRQFVDFGQVVLQLQVEFALMTTPASVFVNAAPLLTGNAVLLKRWIRTLVVETFHLGAVRSHRQMVVQRVVMGCKGKETFLKDHKENLDWISIRTFIDYEMLSFLMIYDVVLLILACL